MTRTQVSRWSVGLVATLALAAVGLLYANATLLAATLIPLTYVLFGAVSSLPDDRTLHVERTIESATPAPGTAIEVTLSVENQSDSVLPDVRIIDGVPEELAVAERTPRLCTSLSPGETDTLSYLVIARRGTATFDQPVARFRSLAGSEQETRELDVAGHDELVAVSTLETGPRQTQTAPHTGTVTTDSGGSGLEFHSTRQYRQGDPVNRIDWHHVAKTGEFITVQYREQKVSRTVLVVDARSVARVRPAPAYPTAVDRSVYAAEQLYGILTEAGIETTIAAVGLAETTVDSVEPDPAGIVWAGPDRKTSPRAVFEAITRAETHGVQRPSTPPRIGLDSSLSWAGADGNSGQDGSSSPRASARADGGDETMRLLRGIPGDARVILCSPLVDNWPVRLCRTLAGNHEQVVVSPDPVGTVDSRRAGDDRIGQRITAVNRQLRLREVQRVQASTVDWPVDEPFETALRDAVPMLLSHR